MRSAKAISVGAAGEKLFNIAFGFSRKYEISDGLGGEARNLTS